MEPENNVLSAEAITQNVQDLIKKGQPLPELLVNTTYLFDTWVCAALPRITNDTEFLHDVDLNLTTDQRFHIFLGCTGAILDKDYGGRVFFNIIRHAYRLKAMMNWVSEAELMKEVWKLAAKFNSIDDDDAPKFDELKEELPPSVLADIEERPELKYPPDNDAEAVDFIGDYFGTAMAFCGEFIRGYIEQDEGDEGDGDGN